jgi:hypothetical protein
MSLLETLRETLSATLQGTLSSLYTHIADTHNVFGAFSRAFSVAFDILPANRREFSNAFDFSFARFELRKEFSSAFANDFTNTNR